MKLKKQWIAAIAIIVGVGFFGVFQNCARAKFVDPDHLHSALAMGLCQICTDDAGNGLSCRQSTANSFSSCNYESCMPGYQLSGNNCVAVVCTPGAIANCPTPHGEGRMTCAANSQGYSACTAISCTEGYHLASGHCVANTPAPSPSPDPSPSPSPSPGPSPAPSPDPGPAPAPSPDPSPAPSPSPDPTPACTPGNHIDCSSNSTSGSQTCLGDGSAYGQCVLGDCLPGFNKDDSGLCVANACTPSTVTPCVSGDGFGFQTCNSIGSGWGVCEINGCQPGFNLISGVCVVQTCVPGSLASCDFAHGNGLKTCNAQGTDYGVCQIGACNKGFVMGNNGQCVDQVCEPGSSAACQTNGGTGTQTCNQNGMGYSNCNIDRCDQDFRLTQNQCVSEGSCLDGETFACTGENGSGLRHCRDDHKIGPCVMNMCNENYQLVNEGNSPACGRIPP